MEKNHNLQINKNFKFLFILSVLFLTFYNTQIFSLVDAPILNQFLSYFLSPLQYMIVICLGYLAINKTYRWKEYGKMVLYLIPLYLISGIFAIDFFNVKEYGFN
ncbi:MAG: hypothetical protein E7Y34_02720, partial [Mycoplasma sp.]|nr:hypothetical protein [Mycoplasma sp.]